MIVYIYPTTSCFKLHCAEVVELVDALVSGTSERKLVGVRIPPSAPFIYKYRIP